MIRMEHLNDVDPTRWARHSGLLTFGILGLMLALTLGWIGFEFVALGGDLAGGTMRCGDQCAFGVTDADFARHSGRLLGG